MDNIATPIINSHNDKLDIKYNIHNGNHMVYVGLGDQVRRVIFPTKESAGSFIKSLSLYRNLKVRV